MKPTKLIFISIIILVIIFTSSCGFSIDDAWYEKHNPKKLERQEAEMIFEYLKDKDIENLVNLFSSYCQNSHDLESELEEFFGMIDGKIVSYDGLSFPGEGLEVDKDGEIFDSHLSVYFNNVTTDTGKEYPAIVYYKRRVYKSMQSKEGISIITLHDKDEDGEEFESFVVGEM